MWGFPLMFWLVLLLIFWFVTRRRHRYWVARDWAVDPRYLWSGWGPPPRRPRRSCERRRRSPQASEEEQSYIDALETRISQLEERLDFTEKLLEKRASSTP